MVGPQGLDLYPGLKTVQRLSSNGARPCLWWRVTWNWISAASARSMPSILLEFEHGALATSGDAHRFLIRDGIRYGHVLDPRTGWPIAGAPRSATVAASSCVEAGLPSTLALLKGTDAEAFLTNSGCRHWILR